LHFWAFGKRLNVPSYAWEIDVSSSHAEAEFRVLLAFPPIFEEHSDPPSGMTIAAKGATCPASFSTHDAADVGPDDLSLTENPL
jgi:hypothetical protein